MADSNEQRTSKPIDLDAQVNARLSWITSAFVYFTIVLAGMLIVVSRVAEGRVTPNIWVVFIALVGLVALLYLIKRGYTGEAALGLLLTLFVLVVAVVLARGTVQVPGTSLLIVACALGGLVFGKRGMILTMAGGVLMLGCLALAEANGLLGVPERVPLFSFWLAITVFSVATGTIIAFSRGISDEALDRARLEIVEREVAEAQLREVQKMQALGTLAGGIAHDFNNIIATILGNAELAREDAANNAKALESLDEITKAARRGRELVRQILSYSRRQPSEFKRIALCPVLEEAARLLRSTLPARVKLLVDCATDVPSILADATQIQQVVLNLATNALQAMRDMRGVIDIRLDTVFLDAAMVVAHPALYALQEQHPGNTVRLSVSDTGPGMSEEVRARIFEPFFTTKPVGEGTGLGLSVVHGIVSAHGGVVEVESEPGRGATFTIYLPVAGAASSAAE